MEAGARDKAVDWFARLLAAIGVTVAAFNLGFNFWKMKRDRRNSIEDDFWFRKIITPSAIEPMLEKFGVMSKELPTRTTPAADLKSYSLKVTEEFVELYSALEALALFEPSLPGSMEGKLRACEDLLTDYCGVLAQPSAPGAIDPAVSEIRRKLWAGLNQALVHVKESQLKR